MKYIKRLFVLSGLIILSSCTNLDETIYDQVSTENYYNTKMDVTRAVFRPFEHAYWSVCSRQVLQELSSDLVATWKKDDWWEDGGRWSRLHYHTWTIEDGEPKTEWDGCFVGVMQCNYVIDDLNTLNPSDYGFTTAEFENLKAQCRPADLGSEYRLLDAELLESCRSYCAHYCKRLVRTREAVCKSLREHVCRSSLGLERIDIAAETLEQKLKIALELEVASLARIHSP